MDVAYFIIWTFCIVFAPITALISFITFIPIFLISCFFTSFGKFITYKDAWLDEDFVNNIPGMSLVITLNLQGDLSLKELRNLFINNVLNARSTLNPKKLRYPELKQYLTTFLFCRIWKNDPNFLIEDHITECCLDNLQCDKFTLGNIHQKYINQPYKKLKSPWELVLIRDINSNTENNSILVFKMHHVMADAKSVLKLLVECLGNKNLKTATPNFFIEDSNWKKMKFISAFPKNYIMKSINLWILTYKNYHHPWNNVSNYGNYSETHLKMVVAFSPKLEMADIKKVAVKNDVKPSAVLMCIITGAVRKHCGDKWDKDVLTGYILPKPNHPEYLTNHLHNGILSLPTEEDFRIKRLQLCNQRLTQIKVDQQFRYLNVNLITAGICFHPFSRIITTIPMPIGITNNAGEEEGFSVGNAVCTDFWMSVGTSHRFVGVVFCTMSYKGGIRIAVIAKESIMKKETTEQIAKDLALELKLLEE